ncbi:hypothetical protein CEUSTIGMA_g8536.t1 [Chlamydomonas eustigma]|uniref:Uncharacterized protein n=1 Tax=Chlamydomonas eustigma TaxID=1157962 RepID=A0A250XDX7_9CHLO|nr:hypothetical protein CEUSTIGMA_g8536.t1 [Chlamydomonas eustigma]|eukprot:GAX81102.1 hypothetical protein CEUSTIGMA_g8536.t1 [Chlamydomonas eustigma]
MTKSGRLYASESNVRAKRAKSLQKDGKNANAFSLYETEEPEADEVKNSSRYDAIESYEYELPETFNDEEIDEDMAFTAEDKMKYAGWFSDEDEHSVEEPSDEPHVDSGVSILDSEEEGVPTAGGYVDVSLEHSDDFLGGMDDDESENSEMPAFSQEEEGDVEKDDDRHQRMLDQVTGKVSFGRDSKVRKQALKQLMISEAGQETEFGLNPGSSSTGAAGDLTVEELMKSLGSDERRKLTPASRKILEHLKTKPAVSLAGTEAGSGKGRKRKLAAAGAALAPVAAPLPRLIKERQERKAGYEDTKEEVTKWQPIVKEEVTKWQPIVKANREAPTLVFTSARGEVGRINTTQAIVAQHTPETALEEEVAALLEKAGAASAKAVQEAEEKLALKSLTLEEVRARQERLAKMRSLLFHHELKAKRLKAIKSKDYRKRLAKVEKLHAKKTGASIADEEADSDAERAAEAEAEFERARERLTLRHRNTSKWARRALKRGVEVMDAGTKEALAEQLRLGQSLRRKIEGKDEVNEDSDDDDDEISSSEGGENLEDGTLGDVRVKKGLSAKAKAAALHLITGDADATLPKKGLFSLPFMSRALQKQRIEAQETAAQILQEDAEGKGFEEAGARSRPLPGSSVTNSAGRMRFGSSGAPGSLQVPFGFEDIEDGLAVGDAELDSDVDEDLESKAERLGLRLKVREENGAVVGEGGTGVSMLPDRLSHRVSAEAATGSGARRVETASASHRAHFSSAAARSVESGRADLFTSRPQANTSREEDKTGTKVAPVPFIPSKSFTGSRIGYAFKNGLQGLGYYTDPKPGLTAAKPTIKESIVPSLVGPVAVIAGQRSKEHQQKRKGLGDASLSSGGSVKGLKTAVTAQEINHHAQARNQSRNEKDGGDDSEEEAERVKEGMRPIGGKAQTQKDLISLAFAGDDVEAEFAAEKAEDVASELPKIEEPSTLPGWGMWSSAQREPKWMRDAKEKAKKDRETAAAGRSDAKIRNVVISEKWDKKAAKYTASSLPFPYTSKEVYESSLRQPLGPEYNPDSSFRNLTRPAVLKTTGVVITPARYGKNTARDAAAGITVDERGVARVEGGMTVLAQKNGKEGTKKPQGSAQPNRGGISGSVSKSLTAEKKRQPRRI